MSGPSANRPAFKPLADRSAAIDAAVRKIMSPVRADATTRPGVMTAEPATAEPDTTTAEPDTVSEGESEAVSDRPWVTIVWDDPINLMNYVTHVFMTVFGYPEPKATRLMLQVHQLGKAIVSSGPRERMEFDVSRLHSFGLWATVSKQS
jgi:ATP-dependent Clp protease adaptor protein ClpS